MKIDFHTHIFPEKIAARTMEKLSSLSHTKPFTDSTAGQLAASMKANGIDISIALPVITNPAQTAKINDFAMRVNETSGETGIISFGGMHPDTEMYKAELKRLSDNGVKGIKLHPPYQGTYIDDIRYMRIIDSALSLGLIVTVHAGVDIGLPSPIYCPIDGIVKVLDELHPDKLILAHMGGWQMWDEVEQKLCGRDDVYFDTSFSYGEIVPMPGCEDIISKIHQMGREQFMRIVRSHGSDKILFGTDCPWGHQGVSAADMESLPFTDEEKENIFHKNAEKLLFGRG